MSARAKERAETARREKASCAVETVFPRCVHDHDALLGGGGEVNVVDSDTGTANDNELLGGFDHLLGYL